MTVANVIFVLIDEAITFHSQESSGALKTVFSTRFCELLPTFIRCMKCYLHFEGLVYVVCVMRVHAVRSEATKCNGSDRRRRRADYELLSFSDLGGHRASP